VLRRLLDLNDAIFTISSETMPVFMIRYAMREKKNAYSRFFVLGCARIAACIIIMPRTFSL